MPDCLGFEDHASEPLLVLEDLRAGLPRIPDAPRVRIVQLEQLRPALRWAARALGLPCPDGPVLGAARS